MRHRKIKGLTIESIEKLGVITKPTKLNVNNVNLEIGAGKGHFITTIANDHLDQVFIAFEKNINAAIRIIEKVNQLNLTNVFVILDDAKNLLEYLNYNSVTTLYLNFSDPWPKVKHHKRRLTHQSFIPIYLNLLNINGNIQFRTDHYEFFVDSICYLKDYFILKEVDLNYQSNEYYTEYEMKRLEKGNLYQLKGVLKDESI